jgi:hypothetical protein
MKITKAQVAKIRRLCEAGSALIKADQIDALRGGDADSAIHDLDITLTETYGVLAELEHKSPTSKGAPDDRGYQGWRNRQTWNVALWLNNDQGLYRAMQHCRRTLGRCNAEGAKTFVTELLPNGTPDMKGPDVYRGVHWAAIARVINESVGGE